MKEHVWSKNHFISIRKYLRKNLRSFLYSSSNVSKENKINHESSKDRFEIGKLDSGFCLSSPSIFFCYECKIHVPNKSFDMPLPEMGHLFDDREVSVQVLQKRF